MTRTFFGLLIRFEAKKEIRIHFATRFKNYIYYITTLMRVCYYLTCMIIKYVLVHFLIMLNI